MWCKFGQLFWNLQTTLICKSATSEDKSEPEPAGNNTSKDAMKGIRRRDLINNAWQNHYYTAINSSEHYEREAVTSIHNNNNNIHKHWNSSQWQVPKEKNTKKWRWYGREENQSQSAERESVCLYVCVCTSLDVCACGGKNHSQLHLYSSHYGLTEIRAAVC